DRFLHFPAVEIDAFDDIETDFSERRAHGAGVIGRVLQRGRAGICAVADDQSESFSLFWADAPTEMGFFFGRAILRTLRGLNEDLVLTAWSRRTGDCGGEYGGDRRQRV